MLQYVTPETLTLNDVERNLVYITDLTIFRVAIPVTLKMVN